MQIYDYCKSVDTELTMWKNRLYSVISRIDHLPTGDKQRMYEEVNGLHIVMSELEDRIENLRTACPTEWKPAENEVANQLPGQSSRFNDTAGVLFDYEFGG
jgi:hypothetical protein